MKVPKFFKPRSANRRTYGAGQETRGSTSSKALAFVATAIFTGAVSYGFGVAIDIRKTQIQYVNAQIEKLYGPLFALSQANDRVWRNFNGPNANGLNPDFDKKSPPTFDQVERWRHWMKTTFQPLNLKMEEAIVKNSHLLIGDDVPSAFQILLGHTEEYGAVIAAWRDDDLPKCRQMASPHQCAAIRGDSNTTTIAYPDWLVTCIKDEYIQLKRRQQKLEKSFIFALCAPPLTASASCKQSPLS